MNITRFYFEGEAWQTDTYLRGIVSFERAVNLAREVQSCSALALVRIWHSTKCVVSGTNSDKGERHRVFEFTDKPRDEKIDLSSYQHSLNGLGTGVYLRLFVLDKKGDQHHLTVPNPIRILEGESQTAFDMMVSLKRIYCQSLDITAVPLRTDKEWRFIYPNLNRRMMDEFRDKKK